MNKPTELAIVLATMPEREHPMSNDGWVFADSVCHRLRRLGFSCSTQQAASWLKRMATVDFAPWIETRDSYLGGFPKQYRVTQWGSNDVENKLGIDLETPWTRAL